MQIAKSTGNTLDYIFQKLKLLLNSGADVNIVNYDGFTGISIYKYFINVCSCSLCV